MKWQVCGYTNKKLSRGIVSKFNILCFKDVNVFLKFTIRIYIWFNQFCYRWTGLTLKLKIGRKGYVIIPKAIRESVGIEEGDEVIVEVGDGITLKPIKKVDIEKLRSALKNHLEKLRSLPGLKEPTPGELTIPLEEEFDE